ncbi:hypothetical protein [Chitinophaga filiformis]|uniref:Uncharacterized protein n=1 Tax=Chitinophaga filiformis TaxID=104663 RepID=A0A1G7LJ01_CHIFI|nr:hypothetical protein [Chitinophaga filiformis]SDF49512.1 hypothetical protein SAMN04488121_10285 [Chitinophaga filiformis]
MKKFKLTNTTDTEMSVIFEPIGDVFRLPSNENIELSVSDEEIGVDDCSLNIAVGVVNKKTMITIFAEKNKFEARYKGQPVNIM